MGFSLKFNVSTAHVKEAYLAKNIANEDAEEPEFEKVGTEFHQSDGPFFLVVITAGLIDKVNFLAKWIVVDAAGTKDFLIDEAGYDIEESGLYFFYVTLPRFWPIGKYKVELYMRGEIDRSIEFTVASDEG